MEDQWSTPDLPRESLLGQVLEYAFYMRFSGDSNAQQILVTFVNANFLVLELIISVCLPSCLENELSEEQNSVLLISIFMP